MCLFLLPQLASVAFEEAAKVQIGLYGIWDFNGYVCFGSPVLFALYQAFKLLSYIDKNQAFSQISVMRLRKSKTVQL